MRTTSQVLAPLRTSRVALVTTYKRDGQGVPTPVGIRLDSDRAYFTTRAKTWKVRRLARNPLVTVAPCDKRGQIRGDPEECTVRCTARKIETGDPDTFEARFWIWVYRVFYRDVPVTYELTPLLDGAPDEPPSPSSGREAVESEA